MAVNCYKLASLILAFDEKMGYAAEPGAGRGEEWGEIVRLARDVVKNVDGE
jgi:hypothetical protein